MIQKCFFFTLVLVLKLNLLFGQQNFSRYSEFIYLKNHISINIGSSIYFIKNTKLAGIGDLNIYYKPGINIGSKYSMNLNKNYSLSGGINLGVHRFAYGFLLDTTTFTIPWEIDQKAPIFEPFINIPLTVTPRIFISKRSILSADLGISFNYYWDRIIGQGVGYYDNGNYEEVFDMEIEFSNNNAFNYYFGLSYGYMLKNKDILKVGMSYNLGTKPMMEGRYYFLDDNKIVGMGELLSNGSFLAMNLNYVFTRTNKTEGDIDALNSIDRDTIKKDFSKNILFFELGGAGLLYSINYERLIFTKKSSMYTIRGGIAGLPAGTYNGKEKIVLSMPILLNYIVGNGKNHLELGMGVTILNGPKGSLSYSTTLNDASNYTKLLENAFIGYRYQKPIKGLVFRIGLTPLWEKFNDFTLSAGMSLGYSFNN